MRKIYCTILGAFLVSLMSLSVTARPVSYPGGWTLIWNTTGVGDSLLFHYSPTAKYSLGGLIERNRDLNTIFYGGQYTRLLKRWNTRDSQTNLYFTSGLGAAFNSGSDDFTPNGNAQIAGFLKASADWETRRLFTSYSVRGNFVDTIPDRFEQVARLGVAPYVADYGKLHTWLMVEIAHRPENEDELSVTPFVRFFKSRFMFEAGISDRGEARLSATVRF
jgi:hypothetical protein